LTQDELEERCISKLFKKIETFGMKNLWYSIKIEKTPTLSFIQQIVRDLEEGKVVVINSRGGLQRAGLVASLI